MSHIRISPEDWEKAQAIVASMTLQEKVAQLGSVGPKELLENGKLTEDGKELLKHGIGQITRLAGASDLSPAEAAKAANEIQDYLFHHTRLKIPALLHEECLSGYMAKEGTTFPQSIGMASSFEPELQEQTTVVTRRQMRAVGAHLGLSPVLDLARDLRWGRVEETFGEDPYLVSSMAAAYVRGLQGSDLKQGIVATLKHFAGHGVCEGGRNHAPVSLGEKEMREEHLLPFEAVIKEEGALSVMNAYHDWDGEPCASSRRLLTTILREEWGFEGIVVSDYWSIPMLNTDHRITPDEKHSGVLALQAGLDIELPEVQCYGEHLMEAIQEGLITENVVDVSAQRHIALKLALGIFEQRFVQPVNEKLQFETDEHRQLARKAAQHSMVLLKNEGSLLPLSKESASIAIIGPNAASTRSLLGDYAYSAHVNRKEDAVRVISVLEGISSRVAPQTNVIHEEGCSIVGMDRSGIPAAVEAARQAEVAVLVVGGRSGLAGVNVLSDEERYVDFAIDEEIGESDGEFHDRISLGLPGVQQELVEAVIATGTPTVVVLVNGRPLALPWLKEHATAIVEAWLPGEEGGNAVADVLFGDHNPSGRLPVSIPKDVGQTPVHYNRRYISQNRHYLEVDSKPLYPFGFGLSYTTFEYGGLSVVIAGEALVVSFTVTNIGERAGRDVPQVYVSDRVASRTRPLMELKGFCSVHLASGEGRQLRFSIPLELLSFLDQEGSWITEPGDFLISVGYNAENLPLQATVTLSGDKRIYPVRTRFFSACVMSVG